MFVPLFFLGKPTILQQQRDTKLHSCFFAVSALLLVLIMFNVSQCLKVVNGNSSQKSMEKREIWESYRVNNLNGFSMFKMSSLFSHVFFFVFRPSGHSRCSTILKNAQGFYAIYAGDWTRMAVVT